MRRLPQRAPFTGVEIAETVRQSHAHTERVLCQSVGSVHRLVRTLGGANASYMSSSGLCSVTCVIAPKCFCS